VLRQYRRQWVFSLIYGRHLLFSHSQTRVLGNKYPAVP
jgi:hypothetical protein